MKSMAVPAAVLLLLSSPAAGQTGQWRTLVAGTSLDAWRCYKSDAPPQKWVVRDGVMTKDGRASVFLHYDH